MGFLSICPRDHKYLNYSVGSIPLQVIRDDGVEMTPSVDITVSNLNGNSKHFLNNSHTGGSFKIKVIIHRNEGVSGVTEYDGNKKLVDVLDYIIRNMIPVNVHTSAIDIDNRGLYIITSNPSRKQTYKDYTVWDLTFTSYTPLNLFKYVNDNTAILNAIKKFKKKSTKSASTNKSKLSKCNYKKLKYSKKKKTSKCVKYMQKVLYKNKCLAKKQIDGWYGNKTVTAVKKFQKKKKLKQTGKINKKTFKALCK